MPSYGDEGAPWSDRNLRDGANAVVLRSWCKAIARRVEAQFGRYWMLDFAVWNYIFRTSVNMSRSFYLHGRRASELTAVEIEEGSRQIYSLLGSGKYVDASGRDGVNTFHRALGCSDFPCCDLKDSGSSMTLTSSQVCENSQARENLPRREGSPRLGPHECS